LSGGLVVVYKTPDLPAARAAAEAALDAPDADAARALASSLL
jgi:hypothetical protein